MFLGVHPCVLHDHHPTHPPTQLDAFSFPIFLGVHTFSFFSPSYRAIQDLPLWIHVQWYLGVLPQALLLLLAPAR